MELLVVSMIMVMVMMITTQFWAWFSPSITDIIARERILRESHLAMQFFAHDFGSAVRVDADSNGTGFIVTRKDVNDANVEVHYSFENDTKTIIRRMSSGEEFTIADGISSFTVVTENPLTISLELEHRGYYAHSDPIRRELVFHWSPP